MQYFNFSRLITKYKSHFEAVTITEGYYNEHGDWVKGENENKTISGAVISHRESKIFRSEGRLTAQDKRLFTLEPIDKALQGAKVIYDGALFSIEDNVENAKFTGVYAYTLKYISAFKETRADHDITDSVEDLEQRLDGVLVEETHIKPESEIDTAAKELGERLEGVSE